MTIGELKLKQIMFHYFKGVIIFRDKHTQIEGSVTLFASVDDI